MKTIIVFLLVTPLLMGGCAKDNSSANCGIIEDVTSNPKSMSVLFIGTSHTFYNDLPKLVSAIANSIGDSVYTEMSAPGGYDFERHFMLEATKSALRSRKWDCIVLQESGWRAALPASLAEKEVYQYADSLKRVINVNNPTARLILYMTNGYIGGVNAFGDTAWCRSDPQVCNFEGMAARIKETYLTLAAGMNAEVAPCGLMWKLLKSRNNNIVLHDPDGMHPGLAGSYSNALTIYSVIRKKTLQGVFIPANVSNTDATLIQNTVAEVLFNCNPDWKDL